MLPILEYRGVRKSFAGAPPVLDGFDLSVAPGETVALVGPSGSGKTTALKLANRLLEADAGEVRVFERPVEEQDPIALRRRIGFVIQEGGLLPHWTVRENVETVTLLLGWASDRRRARSEELLRMVGLPPEEFSSRRPRQLSGGQRQRVGVARALAADPPLVLMDEPFGSLDPIARKAAQNEFRSWKRRLTSAVLLVTHDLREAFALGDRIAVVHEGRIRQEGSREDLTMRPADDFVREFVSELAS